MDIINWDSGKCAIDQEQDVQEISNPVGSLRFTDLLTHYEGRKQRHANKGAVGVCHEGKKFELEKIDSFLEAIKNMDYQTTPETCGYFKDVSIFILGLGLCGAGIFAPPLILVGVYILMKGYSGLKIRYYSRRMQKARLYTCCEFKNPLQKCCTKLSRQGYKRLLVAGIVLCFIPFGFVFGGPMIYIAYFNLQKFNTIDERIPDNQWVMNSVKELAYGFLKHGQYYPESRFILRMLGFAQAVDFMRTVINPAGLYNVSSIGGYDSVDSRTLKNRILQELQDRSKLEMRLPQELFKKLIGEEITFGVLASRKKFYSVEEAVREQENCLKEVCYMDEKLELQLLNGVPAKLMVDLVKLFGTKDIGFDLKSEKSIERKHKQKLKKSGEGDYSEIGDLVRCRVLIHDIFAAWEFLIPSVINNWEELHMSGLRVRLQNHDADYSQTSFNSDGLLKIKWPGLKLEISYGDHVVEAQVVSKYTMLSYGNRLSHDIRDGTV